MKTFYEWLMEHLKETSDAGQLAKFIRRHVDKMPALKTIDSFGDLVDIVDENKPERFCGDLSLSTMKLIKESIWVQYCCDTGHPVR